MLDLSIIKNIQDCDIYFKNGYKAEFYAPNVEYSIIDNKGNYIMEREGSNFHLNIYGIENLIKYMQKIK